MLALFSSSLLLTDWITEPMVSVTFSSELSFFLSFELVSNLSLPPLFSFCLATAVIMVFFWSAVIASGKTGADGV